MRTYLKCWWSSREH